ARSRRRTMKITSSITLPFFLTGIVFAMSVGITQAKSRGGGGDADGFQKKGIELMDARHFDQAIEEFNKAVAAAPTDPRTYHNRGLGYLAAAQAAEAARDVAGAATRYTAALNDFSK